MQEFLSINYEWLRALHLIAVISWMAGLLYLPRLFVYHASADAAVNSDRIAVFKIMQRRLLRFIMNPAMIGAWIFGGLMLAANPAMMTGGGWIHLKLLCVLAMSGMHGMMAKWRKDFEADRNTKSPKFFRLINEVPTALMIVIVIMAVVQPF